MLKIKENVDLKELEKFGFKYDEYGDLYKDLEIKEYFINRVENLAVMIDLTDKRHLRRIGYIVDEKYCFDYELDTLYDLIKADLVEKVEEKE